MTYYINNISTFDNLTTDVKLLIPNMNMRRRMSRFVKMGVATGVEALQGFEREVDAIITSTSLGCLTDSEKFLNSIIENHEQGLNPTPFIQSTFNTIGAQIGLITKNHCYNMTYSQRSTSFESAVLDATLRMNLGQAEAVLIGAIDEATTTQCNIFRRLKIADGECYEGAMFFVMSRERGENSIAKMEIIEIDNRAQNYFKVSESRYVSSFSASAFLFGEVTCKIQNGEFSSAVLINDTIENESFRLKISKL